MATQKVAVEKTLPFVLRNRHGSVTLYTRHTDKCLKDHPEYTRDHHDCQCFKWVYVKPKKKKANRYTVDTPLWEEAVAEASDILDGLDPREAEHRAIEAKREAGRIPIKDACAKFMAETMRRYRDKFEEKHKRKPTQEEEKIAGTPKKYRGITNKLTRWAQKTNIESFGEITTDQLRSWYESEEWTRQTINTRSYNWVIVKMVFRHIHSLKLIDHDPTVGIKRVAPAPAPVQGPYEVEQLDKIFAQVYLSPIPPQLEPEEQAVYRERFTAFLTALRYIGCDAVDAVLYQPGNIKPQPAQDEDEEPIDVYRYHRTKTGKLAVVPLDADVVGILKDIPMLASNPPRMPFRRKGRRLDLDVRDWCVRITNLLDEAGVEKVLLGGIDHYGNPLENDANTKQFRHSFAVGELEDGQTVDAVARMLGNDPRMVKKHYAPFVKRLDDAHVNDVVRQRKRRAS